MYVMYIGRVVDRAVTGGNWRPSSQCWHYDVYTQCTENVRYDPQSRHLYVRISLSMSVSVSLSVCLQCESKKYPPEVFPNGWEFFVQILYAYCTFQSTLDCKFIFNYLQLWLSYAILSATTHFPWYAQCPSSAETHAFRCLRKSLTALLIVVVCC